VTKNAVPIKLIELYRAAVSPIKRPCCRFTPTCSQYALEAFSAYGFFKALRLSAARILRCHPWGPWGYDPLPAPDQMEIVRPRAHTVRPYKNT